MATKLNSPIHREVKLTSENGEPCDYIVTLKPGEKPSLVLRLKRHRSELEIPLEVLLAPTEWVYEYEGDQEESQEESQEEKKPSLMPSKIVEQIPYCLESKLEELSADDGMETWKDYPAEFPVSEAEYMLSTYYEDGHVNCWALEEKEPDAKQEVRELKTFIKKFNK